MHFFPPDPKRRTKGHISLQWTTANGDFGHVFLRVDDKGNVTLDSDGKSKEFVAELLRRVVMLAEDDCPLDF